MPPSHLSADGFSHGQLPRPARCVRARRQLLFVLLQDKTLVADDTGRPGRKQSDENKRFENRIPRLAKALSATAVGEPGNQRGLLLRRCSTTLGKTSQAGLDRRGHAAQIEQYPPPLVHRTKRNRPTDRPTRAAHESVPTCKRRRRDEAPLMSDSTSGARDISFSKSRINKI